MSRRGDKERRERRRQRNVEARHALLAMPPRPTRNIRWIKLFLGKDPRTHVTLQPSGVLLPFDETDPEPNAGLPELTALAQAADPPDPD